MKLHDISLFFPSESPIPFSANEFRDETISDNGDDDNESNGSVKCSVKCSVEKLSSSEKIAAYLSDNPTAGHDVFHYDYEHQHNNGGLE